MARFGPLLLMLLAAAVLYGPALDAPFIFDDVHAIVENPQVRALWPLGEALRAPPQSSFSGRPFVSLSIAFNYALSGLDPWSYHALNLALHAAVGTLAYLLLRRLLARPALPASVRARAAPLAAAASALWFVHPLNSETVVYVTQRTELWVAFFYLVTLEAATRSFEADARGKRALWQAVAVVACALGMASKEVAVSAPLLVWLADRTFYGAGFRAALRRSPGLYAGLAACWLLLAWLVAPGQRSASAGLGLGIPPLHYLATQAGVLLWYLRLCVWPDPLAITYEWPIASRLGEAAAELAVVSALACATLVAVLRRPALGFAGAWFFLILAPTSSFVPIGTEVAAEKRMYLPLLGVVALLVVAVDRGLRRMARPQRARIAGLALLVLCGLGLSARTALRVRDYASVRSIWLATLQVFPAHRWAHEMHHEIALSYAREGDLARAIEHYESAIRARPDYVEAWVNLGNARLAGGEYESALEAYRTALSIDGESWRAHYNLGLALARLGRLAEAEPHLRGAAERQPDYRPAHQALARLYRDLGDPERAAFHDERARQLLGGETRGKGSPGSLQ